MILFNEVCFIRCDNTSTKSFKVHSYYSHLLDSFLHHLLDWLNSWRCLSVPGLLRMSTSWIFEPLVPILKDVTDILIFFHSLPCWRATFWDRRSLRTETTNLEIQGGEDVDVLRRPGQSLSSSTDYCVVKLWFFKIITSNNRDFIVQLCNSISNSNTACDLPSSTTRFDRKVLDIIPLLMSNALRYGSQSVIEIFPMLVVQFKIKISFPCAEYLLK